MRFVLQIKVVDVGTSVIWKFVKVGPHVLLVPRVDSIFEIT